MTVVMVTHERPLAERFANRTIFLSDGKLVGNPSSGETALSRGDAQ
jgi:ABC-type polar amino acid transport system ATPase subunit